ncbi:hypothetical protein MMC26_005367 [Xylographa opegraphella]|nr:hypothetical protein [Xylographa opegraphella]
MQDNADSKGKCPERKDSGKPKEYPRVYSPPVPKVDFFGRRTYERPTVERSNVGRPESLPAHGPSKPPAEPTPAKQDIPAEPVKGSELRLVANGTLDVDDWISGENLPMDMALLYIEAYSFGLDLLKQLIVSKFETMPALKDNPTLVLQLAEQVYPHIPKVDKLFKALFIKALEQCREGPARFPEGYADTLIAKGGDPSVGYI